MMCEGVGFWKKLYKDQYNFNRNIYEHLDRALQLVPEDTECVELIREGIYQIIVINS